MVCVSELAVCSSSLVAIDGRIAARPLVKNGDANISSPLSTYSSHGVVAVHREDEAGATTARDQVARDHHRSAVEPVEQDAGERARQHRGNGARQHHAADDQARLGGRRAPG